MQILRPSTWMFILLGASLAACSSQHPLVPKVGRPLPVKVGVVEQHDVPVYIETIGNIVAFNYAEIRPQVSGTIIDVQIKGGDKVEVGDTLYRIDPLPYQLVIDKIQGSLHRDEAALDYARRKVERYAALETGNFVSKLNLEEYKRDVKALEGQVLTDRAELASAKTALDYCTIVSPLKGRVSLTKMDIGNIVSPTNPNPLAIILQITPVYVNFSIAQREFEDLQPILAEGNRKFKVILPGSRREFEGEILATDNQLNSQTGTIQIKGIISNQEEILWPGEFVNVHVFIRTKHRVPIVPSNAVQMGQKGSYVYVLDSDQTVKDVEIAVGERFDEYIVIDKGIEVGAKIITDGHLNLRPGAKVMIIEDEITSPKEEIL